ncbi:MAG: DUF928 domain-containing protein [Symploca sp. SIO2E9]|nr:DUF928 domain-containing protein [Symploca sp. SIO2E9]
MVTKNDYLPLKLVSVALFIELSIIGVVPIHGQEISDHKWSSETLLNDQDTPQLGHFDQALQKRESKEEFNPMNITQYQPASPSQSINSILSFSVTFIPPGVGKPKYTVGAASRGKCPQDAEAVTPYVTPLIPNTNYGFTVAERPTFFVYLPETSAKRAFFSLRDANEDYYYQTIFPIASNPGIISFELPEDAPALEIGKTYNWSLVTICGQALRPGDPKVQGEIKRIELDSEQISKLESMSPSERAVWYGLEGIWYDTLTAIAQLKQSHPKNANITSSWEEILRSVGLEAISGKPLLE